jgi:hypothetical protein
MTASLFSTGKRSVEANIEEDYFNDLLLFMTLLNTLQNKDVINELFEDNATIKSKSDNGLKTPDKSPEVSSISVVLYGLEFLIPLMNEEMLKVR